MLVQKLLSGSPDDKLYSDDVFQSYVRTGTGADVTVTTGIDMTKGYMLWSKGRSGATDHAIYDSERGVTLDLVSNSTAAQTTQTTGLKSVSATGHTVGSLAKMNTSAATYVDFVFRKAPKFFDVVTYTGNGVAGRQIPHALGIAPGMVIYKRTDSTGDLFVWHRSIGSSSYIAMNLTSQAYGSSEPGGLWGVDPTSTYLQIGSGNVNTTGATYVAYLFAHDTSADGIIQCGSFTTDGSGNATVNLGWEPQYVLYKRSDNSSGGDWRIIDTMRGFTVGADQTLFANLSNAEATENARISPSATGFYGDAFGLVASATYIYLAIRRPNKPPTTGTQVYNAVTYTANGTDGRQITGAGFPPDLAISDPRDGYATPGGPNFYSRLTGNGWFLCSGNTNTEANGSASSNGVFLMDGITASTTGANVWSNVGTHPYINHFFKRAPGVFDQVCWTGNGNSGARAISHNLGVAPELTIYKHRSGGTLGSSTTWHVGNSPWVGAKAGLFLNTADAAFTVYTGESSGWSDQPPTSSQFYVIGPNTGTGQFNNNNANYVAYLFATLAGVSKVTRFVGNGTTQNIDCGFSAGARLVLIKATSTTGNWNLGDSTRGIVAGNDPLLCLNTTSAEVTTDDWLDPYAQGFTVNETASAHANTAGVSYLVLAMA